MTASDEVRLRAGFVQPEEGRARADCCTRVSQGRVQRGWSRFLLGEAPRKDEEQQTWAAAREVLTRYKGHNSQEDWLIPQRLWDLQKRSKLDWTRLWGNIFQL